MIRQCSMIMSQRILNMKAEIIGNRRKPRRYNPDLADTVNREVAESIRAISTNPDEVMADIAKRSGVDYLGRATFNRERHVYRLGRYSHNPNVCIVTIGQHVIFYVNMLPYLHESISGRNKFSRLKAFLTEAGYENQVRRSFGDDGRAEFKHSVETANPCATIEGFLTKYREYLENGPN